jgi:hypothetical protein
MEIELATFWEKFLRGFVGGYSIQALKLPSFSSVKI